MRCQTKRFFSGVLGLFLVLFVLGACSVGSQRAEIPRGQAIALARERLAFIEHSVDAEKTEDLGRPVWKVTFYGAPLGRAPVGEVMVVVVDGRTGEVVWTGLS